MGQNGPKILPKLTEESPRISVILDTKKPVVMQMRFPLAVLFDGALLRNTQKARTGYIHTSQKQFPADLTRCKVSLQQGAGLYSQII